MLSYRTFKVPVRGTLALIQGSYLSCPSSKKVKVLIYLACLKCLKVLGGTVKKNFCFSSLILLTYSLLPFKVYFTVYIT